MADTVLKIVKDVCERIGHPVPSILISNSDDQVIQLKGLLNEVGQDLVTRFKWQELTRRKTFPSVAAESQGTLESIFGADLESIKNFTLFNDTQMQPIWGPLSDLDYQFQKTTGASVAYEYKIMGNELLVMPTLPAGHTLSAVYTLKAWLINGSTLKQEITADNDQPLLDDKMMALGLRSIWLETKGLPYAESKNRFESMAIGKAIKSGTKKVLRLDGPDFEARPGVYIPPGNWPLYGG